MHADRLRYYLCGGQPPGGLRVYPGCRNPAAPLRSRPVLLPGGIYFALESGAWTGGTAFYDPTLPGTAAARAYLITSAQFADIAQQEMYRPPPGVAQSEIDRAVRDGSVTLGTGRYETVVCAGALDGYPLLTFTAPWTAAEVTWTKPAPRYLAMLASGLREAHGWDAERIVAYLSACPGVSGRWQRADLTTLLMKTLLMKTLLMNPHRT
jgi:hypothetical protein